MRKERQIYTADAVPGQTEAVHKKKPASHSGKPAVVQYSSRATTILSSLRISFNLLPGRQ